MLVRALVDFVCVLEPGRLRPGVRMNAAGVLIPVDDGRTTAREPGYVGEGEPFVARAGDVFALPPGRERWLSIGFVEPVDVATGGELPASVETTLQGR